MENSGALRLYVFLGLLLLFTLLEAVFARKKRVVKRNIRWRRNLGLGVLGSIAVQPLGLFFVTAGPAVGMALAVDERGWGLLPLLGVSPVWAMLVTVIFLDFAIYVQHVVFHRFPTLWRLHRVHHTDLDLDATSALRFHPVEIVLSMLVKMTLIAVLGASPLGVLVFEMVLNGMAMFNHASLRIPAAVEPWLRAFVVTPDMHRVHHSPENDETNSNYGFNLSCWDRLFGTYIAAPRLGHEEMPLGLAPWRDGAAQHLGWLLWLPLNSIRLAGKDRAGPDAED